MSEPTTVTVELKSPLTADGKALTSLTFNEPTVADLIDGEEAVEGDLARTMFTLGRMCGVPYADFRRIGVRDFKAINEATSSLVGND